MLLDDVKDEAIIEAANTGVSLDGILKILNCKIHNKNQRKLKDRLNLLSIDVKSIVSHKRSIVWTSLSDEEFSKLIAKSLAYSEILRYFNFKGQGRNYDTIKRRIKQLNLNVDHFTGKPIRLSNKIIPLDDIIKHNKYPDYKTGNLKKRLYISGIKKPQCEICNIVKWQGKDISFSLDHIDGNNSNHLLSNLRIICPNCHSQTETFAGKKNKGRKKNRFN